MTNKDSAVELTPAETHAVLMAIADRAQRLGRCRVTLDVELTEAYRTLPLACRAPASCRIIYQRDSDAQWQVTVLDRDKSVLCDAIRDGDWIEVDGKCWHFGYNEYFYDEDDADTEADPLRDGARDALELELRGRLWALIIANGHLWLDIGFLTDRYAPSWEFSRPPEGGLVVGCSRYDYRPGEHRFTFFEWLQWRLIRIIRPGIEIEEYFDRKSVPTRQTIIALNERFGFAPESVHLSALDESSTLRPYGEVWEDPIPVGDGLFMPRIHKVLQTPSGDVVLQRSTLVPDESAFGVSIPLNIRPVDRTLERVDW